MVALLIEGFDAYGPPGVLLHAQASGVAISPVGAGPFGGSTIVAGINGFGGNALQLGSTANTSALLTTTYGRLISGCVFQTSTLAARSGIMCFYNSGSSIILCTLTVETSGALAIHTRAADGTLIASSSTGLIVANTSYWIAWDVTFGASSAFNIYLNGVSVLSGTGNTGNGTTLANTMFLGNIGAGTTTTVTFDDVYLFDSTGADNNSVILTTPVVWTDYATSDSSVAFAFGAATIGKVYTTTASTNAVGANFLFIVPVTPSISCSLAGVATLAQQTVSGVNLKAVVYSDSAGAPNTLIATGNQTTGTTINNTVSSTFSSPPSLVGGTQYWIGFILDTSVTWAEADTGTLGQKIANTYASGAPAGPLGGMTTGQPNWLVFGQVTGTGSNAYEVKNHPALGNASYVSSNTVGATDLYVMTNTAPFAIGTIHDVQISINGALDVAGSRTINLQISSSGTLSSGSLTAQSVSTSEKYYYSEFSTDPHTGAAWTSTALIAATAGMKINS